MIDTSETMGFTLEDFGVQAAINGGPQFLVVDPHLDGSDIFDGETVDHSGPFALASMADVVEAGLVAGNNGDTLTINNADFTVLAIDPDGQGGAVLRMEGKP